jgi:protease-4
MTGRKVLFVVLALVAAVLVAIAAGLFVFWAMNQPASIAQGSVLEITLSGGVTEVPPTNPWIQILQPEMLNLFDLRRALERAAHDDRIRAVYLEIQPLSLSFGQVEEIRNQILAFRSSKKPVYAFLAVDAAGEAEMYIASAADRVTVNPGSALLVNGLLAQVSFYKGTLEKLHVKPEFIEFKEYKNPGTYTREQMTPEFRGMLEGLLRDLEGRFVSVVAKDRKIDPNRLRELMAEGIQTDDQAFSEKLVDQVGYKSQVLKDLESLGGKGSRYKGVSLSRYEGAIGDDFQFGRGHKVAYVAAEGTITAGTSESFADVVGGNTLSSLLRKLREDKSIKAVILRVNSPGGSVVGSEMVWEEVRKLEEAGTPVVVSMSGVAASGGYYISMPAQRIISEPSTITGSIGVYFGKFDLSGFYHWVGANVEEVKISPNADILSLYNSLTDEQHKTVEKWMTGVYTTFVTKAAEARKMTFDQMEPKAHGRIYSGEQAKAAGLVDEVGGIDTAVEAVRRALKLGKEETIQLVIYPRPKTLWESLSTGDWLSSKAPTFRLRDWVEAEAKALSTPAPWLLCRDIKFE